MANNRKDAVTLRFAALFAGGSLLVLFWITLESIFIKRLTFSYLFRFSLPATGFLLAVMVVFLSAYVWLRLRSVEQAMSSLSGSISEREDRICRSLHRLPAELFWLTVGYGGLFIPVYHVVHYIVEGHSLFRIETYYLQNFIRSLLYQMSVTFGTAILHYAVARRLVRPMLLRLLNVKGEGWRNRSFLSLLTATFGGLMFVNVSSIVWYVMVARIKAVPIEFSVLVPLVGLNVAFAAAIFVLLAFEFRRELQMLMGSIRSLLGTGRGAAYSKMPVLSNDEVGRLAIVFNHLQDRVTNEYDELAKELLLARQIHLQLLPPRHQFVGSYAVNVQWEPDKAVGSELYDVIVLEDGRFAVLSGIVAGIGMPAALQASAALMLLRAEAEEGGTPSSILARFEKANADIFPRQRPLSLGVILIDGAACRFQASCEGDATVWLNGSPLPSEAALDGEMVLRPDDRLTLKAGTGPDRGEPVILTIAQSRAAE